MRITKTMTKMEETKYFIILGQKALHYDTLEEAEAAKRRFTPIYPNLDIKIYEGKAV